LTQACGRGEVSEVLKIPFFIEREQMFEMLVHFLVHLIFSDNDDIGG